MMNTIIFLQIILEMISLVQISSEFLTWGDILTVSPVVGALGLWIFYLIRQNNEIKKEVKEEREAWAKERKELNKERKELNFVVRDMTDVIDRAYNAIESGNMNVVHHIQSEAENIKLRMQHISDKIDQKTK